MGGPGKWRTMKKQLRIMQVAKTTRFIPGVPAGLPSGSAVQVVATGSGRVQVEALACPGARYWVDADALTTA
jgi:hypothetical protein